MFVHIMHASLTGRQTLMIVIPDTDVVLLDIAGMLSYSNYALWIAFGK